MLHKVSILFAGSVLYQRYVLSFQKTLQMPRGVSQWNFKRIVAYLNRKTGYE